MSSAEQRPTGGCNTDDYDDDDEGVMALALETLLNLAPLLSPSIHKSGGRLDGPVRMGCKETEVQQWLRNSIPAVRNWGWSWSGRETHILEDDHGCKFNWGMCLIRRCCEEENLMTINRMTCLDLVSSAGGAPA